MRLPLHNLHRQRVEMGTYDFILFGTKNSEIVVQTGMRLLAFLMYIAIGNISSPNLAAGRQSDLVHKLVRIDMHALKGTPGSSSERGMG